MCVIPGNSGIWGDFFKERTYVLICGLKSSDTWENASNTVSLLLSISYSASLCLIVYPDLLYNSIFQRKIINKKTKNKNKSHQLTKLLFPPFFLWTFLLSNQSRSIAGITNEMRNNINAKLKGVLRLMCNTLSCENTMRQSIKMSGYHRN